MSNSTPWLTIIGLGEDGLPGLSGASRDALAAAEIVFGAPRHLALADVGARGQAWPVPFSVDPVLACRPRPTVVLASGDPFWFGAGSSVTRHLDASEWRAHPAPSTFAIACARLGWPMEAVTTLGLHAAPLTQLRPHLAQDQRLICLLRDGAAVAELAAFLRNTGFGASTLHILEALGGSNERIRTAKAGSVDLTDIAHLVAVAIHAQGQGLPRSSGLPDSLFAHDGQITKSAIRALTLAALAPRAGETLWDIGAGSGSVSIEWLLAAPLSRGIAFERDETRAARIQANAENFGVADRLTLIRTDALAGLADQPKPSAVFIGGGVSEALLTQLWAILPKGTRLVANAVTLESEALFTAWSAQKGGTLLRIDLAAATPLGSKRGWQSARPVTQWSVVL